MRWRARRLRRGDEATRVEREGKGDGGVTEEGQADGLGEGVCGGVAMIIDITVMRGIIDNVVMIITDNMIMIGIISIMTIDVSTVISSRSAMTLITTIIIITTTQLVNIPAIDLANTGPRAKKGPDPKKTDQVGLEWKERNTTTTANR